MYIKARMWIFLMLNGGVLIIISTVDTISIPVTQSIDANISKQTLFCFEKSKLV